MVSPMVREKRRKRKEQEWNRKEKRCNARRKANKINKSLEKNSEDEGKKNPCYLHHSSNTYCIHEHVYPHL